MATRVPARALLCASRLAIEHASREELLACLTHLRAGAGNASLMGDAAVLHTWRGKRARFSRGSYP
jgi:hypothetical protein